MTHNTSLQHIRNSITFFNTLLLPITIIPKCNWLRYAALRFIICAPGIAMVKGLYFTAVLFSFLLSFFDP